VRLSGFGIGGIGRLKCGSGIKAAIILQWVQDGKKERTELAAAGGEVIDGAGVDISTLIPHPDFNLHILSNPLNEVELLFNHESMWLFSFHIHIVYTWIRLECICQCYQSGTSSPPALKRFRIVVR